jgi:hypothetical protein
MTNNSNDWMFIWLEHFFKHATPVTELPVGWCVYREALDWD